MRGRVNRFNHLSPCHYSSYAWAVRRGLLWQGCGNSGTATGSTSAKSSDTSCIRYNIPEEHGQGCALFSELMFWHRNLSVHNSSSYVDHSGCGMTYLTRQDVHYFWFVSDIRRQTLTRVLHRPPSVPKSKEIFREDLYLPCMHSTRAFTGRQAT